MTKIALIAAVCCAFAAPAFARDHHSSSGVTNVSIIGQGGNGNGQVNTAVVAQGLIAHNEGGGGAPVVSVHSFGIYPVGHGR